MDVEKMLFHFRTEETAETIKTGSCLMDFFYEKSE